MRFRVTYKHTGKGREESVLETTVQADTPEGALELAAEVFFTDIATDHLENVKGEMVESPNVGYVLDGDPEAV